MYVKITQVVLLVLIALCVRRSIFARFRRRRRDGRTLPARPGRVLLKEYYLFVLFAFRFSKGFFCSFKFCMLTNTSRLFCVRIAAAGSQRKYNRVVVRARARARAPLGAYIIIIIHYDMYCEWFPKLKS